MSLCFFLTVSWGAGRFGEVNCAACNRQSDSLALVQLYQFSGGVNWTVKWNLASPIDTWHGVFLNTDGCVSFLNLRNNNLAGLLPNLQLPHLVFLELSDNKLVGSLPNFEFCPALQTMSLGNNFFAGNLPKLKSKSQLRNLSLASNFFSGVLPRFDEAPNLRALDLRNNNFTGNIHQFSENPNLQELYINNNKFGGQIPNFQLTSLIILDASHNNFFGALPFFNHLVNLEILNLSFNNFTGNIPNFPSMGKLETLLLNDNNLFGTLPNFLGLSGLRDRFWLQNNKFSGTIPNFPALFQLEELNLNNNLFDSMAPLTNMLNLKVLRVANNRLTFKDLMPSRHVPERIYEYTPQASIGTDRVIFVPTGGQYTITYNIDPQVPTNEYYWYKDEVFYALTSEPSLTLSNIGFGDKGHYRMEATNPHLPALRILSGRTTILLDGTSINDLCEFAFDLTDSLEICNEFTFFDADLDVADASCGVSGDNVWFKFMAKGPRALIYLNSSTYDRMRLALYQFGNAPCVPAAAEELYCGDLINVDDLVPGREYFISVVGEGRNQMHTFVLCFNNSNLTAPPPNDLPCGAYGVAPMVCGSGTTINATMDVVNNQCVQSSVNSVWYKTRLSTGMTNLRLDIRNNTFFNDVSVMVGTMDDCTGTFTPLPDAVFCDRVGLYSIRNLVSGQDYYIQISSTAVGSGNFSICLEEFGRGVECAANTTCQEGVNGPIDIPVFTRSLPSCYEGCTIGAPPGINFEDNTCYSFYHPTVWYKFTTDDRADFLSVSINSLSMSRPHFAIFKSDDCENFEQVYCRIEGNYKAEMRMAPIERNTTYYLAISDFFGDVGFFNVCLSTFENTSVCNINNELFALSTSMGSPLTGPFQPGEEVMFCYKINFWQYISCNWLQAIIPTFGPCWDRNSFDIVGQPRIINQLPRPFAQGAWRWFVDGEARYNLNNPLMGLRINDRMPAGWYFINEGVQPPPILTDPNTSLGDGVQCALDTLTWELCFTIRTRSDVNCASVANCNIGIKTYSDGEIGARSRAACLGDISTWFNATLDCCRNPETFPVSDLTICSGETIQVPLLATDSLADFNINVLSSFQVEGALPTVVKDTLKQTLINTSDSLRQVTYQVIAEREGCLAPPIQFRVLVYPTPQLTFEGDETICLGDSTALRFIFRGEGPFEVSYRANGTLQPVLSTSGANNQITLRVDPKVNTIYTINQIKGAHGCTYNPQDSVVIQVNPTSRFQLDTAICDGESFWFEGVEYKERIQFSHLYHKANQFGCDSTVDVKLTVGQHYRTTVDTSICPGSVIAIGNNNFDKSGEYITLLRTRLGCDSIVTLKLFVPESIKVTDTLIIHETSRENGVISVNLEGGVPPYTYAWSNGRSTPLIQNLRAGIYRLTVTDNIGCSAEFEFEIDNLTSIDTKFSRGIKLSASPVPQKSGELISISIESDINGMVQYQIMDFSGRLIEKGNIVVNSGHQFTQIKAPAPPGLYWLQWRDQDGRLGRVKMLTY